MAEAKPTRAPEKAHRPRSAAAAGRPRKAYKPPSAGRAPKPRDQPGGGAGKSTRRAGGGSAKSLGKTGSKKASETVMSAVAPEAGKALVKAITPGHPSLVGRGAWKLAKVIAGRTLSSGLETLSDFSLSDFSGSGTRRAAVAVEAIRQTALGATGTSVEADTMRRPPIQAAVDVAVPSRVAWQEWSRLQWLPEGVDGVLDVERDDDELTGHLRGRDSHKWAARVLDEREQQSFAWESTRGSDCAGLVTFHALTDRLTRIELSLDVRPLNVAQAAALSTRIADRRAAADLRRFKARLELINPDAYDDPNDRSD